MDGGQVPECQSDKRRLWVGLPPPVVDYFPSGEKSRWNQNSLDGTQPTASLSCKESIGNIKTLVRRNKIFLPGALNRTIHEMKNSPDVVVIQPQHLQVFNQTDALRNLGQTVVVQQELCQRDECSSEGVPAQAGVAQVIVGQLEGLKAWPQVAEGEGGDVMDVVVLKG